MAAQSVSPLDQALRERSPKFRQSRRFTTTATGSERSRSSLFRFGRELNPGSNALSLEFGSEGRSKVRGKLFLRTSKASWMAFGTFCRLGVAANLVDSASEHPHFAETSPFATLRPITIPVVFKAICYSRRVQLWNRQASIIMDPTTLALRHGWRCLPCV